MIYFTSDTHFGHANVIRFAGRPWQTIEQMGAALVASINARVGMRDELWILGDFSYRLGRDEALAIRQSITCRRVHLVPGNHDRNWAVPELEGAFLLEPPIAKIKYEGYRFVCSHYPIMDWEGMRRGSIQLHGHIHSRPEYNEHNRGRGLFRYDVGVDANGYRPVSIEEVMAFFDGVESGGRVNWREWDEPLTTEEQR